jgi:hypothetical protein
MEYSYEHSDIINTSDHNAFVNHVTILPNSQTSTTLPNNALIPTPSHQDNSYQPPERLNQRLAYLHTDERHDKSECARKVEHRSCAHAIQS